MVMVRKMHSTGSIILEMDKRLLSLKNRFRLHSHKELPLQQMAQMVTKTILEIHQL
jgi:hypothetical protein